MRMSTRPAISTTYFAVGIIVLIIIAAVGWALYATASGTTTTQTQTVTQTQTGAQTVTQTVTQTTTQTLGAQTGLSAPATSTDQFTISTFAAAAVFANFYFVQEQGLAKQYIPDATFLSFSNAGQMVQALSGGQIQILEADPTAVIPAIANGANIEIVGCTISLPTSWQVIVKNDSSYQTLADLHGGTFAASSLTTTTAYLTEYLLSQQFGWQLNKDFSMAGVGSLSSEYASLMSGSINALLQSPLSTYSAVSSGQARSIYNFTTSYPAACLFATPTFVQQHPDAVKATLYTFLQGGLVWNTNPTAAYQTLQKNYGLDATGAAFDYSQLPYSSDGYITLTGLQSAINLLVFGGAMSQNITASSIVSTQFVPVIY